MTHFNVKSLVTCDGNKCMSRHKLSMAAHFVQGTQLVIYPFTDNWVDNG